MTVRQATHLNLPHRAVVMVGSCLLLLATGGPARANDSSLAAAPLVLPDLLTPGAARFELGGLRMVEEGDDDAIKLLTAVLSAQHEVIRGLALHGTLPFARVGTDQGETDLGNVSLGVRYLRRAAAFTAGGSLTVAFPTSPDYDFFGVPDGAASFTAAMLQPERFADFAPDATSYRGTLDFRWDAARGFGQGQVGYQQTRLDSDSDNNLDLLTLTAAAGVWLGRRLALLGELHTTSLVLEEDLGDGDRWLHVASLGGRYQFGAAALGGRLVLPIDTFLDLDSRGGHGIGAAIDLSMRF